MARDRARGGRAARLPDGGRVQVLQRRRAPHGAGAPDRRRRRAGLGPGGAGGDLDLRDRRERREHAAPLPRRAVLGADPADLGDVHARMERAIRPSFSVGQPLAKAAIDLACYDLWGKQIGKPVSSSARKQRDKTEIKLSWTVNADQHRQGRGSSRAGPRRRLRQFQRQDRHAADAGLRPRAGARGARLRAAAASTGRTPTRATTSTPRAHGAASSPTPASRRSSRRCRPTACATTRRCAPGRAADPDGRRHRLAGRGRGVHGARHARRHRHEGGALWRPVAGVEDRRAAEERRSVRLRLRPHRPGPVARGVDPPFRLGGARVPGGAQRAAVPAGAAPPTRFRARATACACPRRRGSA